MNILKYAACAIFSFSIIGTSLRAEEDLIGTGDDLDAYYNALNIEVSKNPEFKLPNIKNLSAHSEDGVSLLHIAVADKNKAMIDYLLRETAKARKASKGNDLMMARYNLLENSDVTGATPLQLAINLKNYEIAEILLDAGADASGTDFHGTSVVQKLASDISLIPKENEKSPAYSLLEKMIRLGADPFDAEVGTLNPTPSAMDIIAKNLSLSLKEKASLAKHFNSLRKNKSDKYIDESKLSSKTKKHN